MPSSYTVKARVVPTEPGLSVARFTGLAPRRGNVGLALSGGGSRSASACMGVCRALSAMGHLGSLRAISSVSGGSWFAVAYTYLPERFALDTFLGGLVDDPSALRLRSGPGPEQLLDLDAGNFGAPLTKVAMDLAHILGDAVSDRLSGVPPHRLWTRQVGEDLLAHFDLASFTDEHLPAEFFAADAAMGERIAAENPKLPQRFHAVRRDPETRRAFLIVNGAMCVDDERGDKSLAPVQFTPLFSGVMGRGAGSLSGRPVGGGGISSHAFGGEWVLGEGETIEVLQDSPLGLSDIAGISSAAHADSLMERSIEGLSPQLIYFSPSWKRPAGTAARFVDAGSLENTGVANLFAYEDIDKVIAVVNGPIGVTVRDDGGVVLDRQVAALFGRQTFEAGRGYPPFFDSRGDPVPGEGVHDYADNQVFSDAKGEFHQLLRAMSKRVKDGAPTAVHQRLELVDNQRFAVRGGRQVEVLWIIQSETPQWEAMLQPAVRAALPPNFPNITTARTGLPARDVSLLAHHSSWVTMRQRAVLDAMFED